jgi:hypothetical protein
MLSGHNPGCVEYTVESFSLLYALCVHEQGHTLLELEKHAYFWRAINELHTCSCMPYANAADRSSANMQSTHTQIHLSV